MKCVSEIHTTRIERESGHDLAFVFKLNAFPAQKANKRFVYGIVSEVILSLENPDCFEQNGFRDPDRIRGNQRSSRGNLAWIVIRQQTPIMKGLRCGDFRQPITSARVVLGNGRVGRSRMPSCVSSTVNSALGFQDRESRIL